MLRLTLILLIAGLASCKNHKPVMTEQSSNEVTRELSKFRQDYLRKFAAAGDVYEQKKLKDLYAAKVEKFLEEEQGSVVDLDLTVKWTNSTKPGKLAAEFVSGPMHLYYTANEESPNYSLFQSLKQGDRFAARVVYLGDLVVKDPQSDVGVFRMRAAPLPAGKVVDENMIARLREVGK